MKYYSSLEKKEILPFATMWMNLEDIILSELSQTAGKMLHTTYKRNVNHRSSDSEPQLLGTEVREDGEVSVRRCKDSVIQDKKVLDIYCRA